MMGCGPPAFPVGTVLYPKNGTLSITVRVVELIPGSYSEYKYEMLCQNGATFQMTKEEILRDCNLEPDDAHLKRWAAKNGPWIYRGAA